ncbi:MAG: beta-galactosidase [Lentisphaeria bacterium]|nr:beta-galactosidase [Lentisphaeria bacterium]
MNRLWLSMIVFYGCLFGQAVEKDVYLTGGWGCNGSQEVLEQYEKAGFTLAPHGSLPWLKRKDFQTIHAVSGRPPADVARPFETADGKLLNSVGLFTHVNFNAPSVEKWWEEYVPRVAKETHNADKIAYWKVHNEFGFHSGELFDYSEGSIAKYRVWLKNRYGAIEKLNDGWGTTWASFDAVEPPRKDLADNLANWLEWRRFTSWNFARYFRETGDMLRKILPNAKVSDNFYITPGLDGWDLFELAKQTDYMAMDIYAIGRWDNLMNNMDVARSAAYAWKKEFLMMEYHAGPNNWITKVYDWQLYTEALLAWARESRALQWYMWNSGKSGREEGIHGILDLAGRPTERMTAVTRISSFAQRFAPLLKRAHVMPKVAVIVSQDSQYYQRAIGKGVWDYMNMNNRLGRMLDLAGIPFVFIDAEQMTELNLDEYQVIIVGAVPVVSNAAMACLDAFATSGKAVVFHPLAATMNEFGQKRVGKQYFKEELLKAEDGRLFASYPLTEGKGDYIVETVGNGKKAYCSWSLTGIDTKDRDAFQKLTDAYADMLLKTTGLNPSIHVASDGLSPASIDVRLLRDKKLNMLYVTKTERVPASVTLTLNDFHETTTGWFYAPDTAAVKKIDGVLADGKLQFKLDLVDNAGNGGILLFGEWQPIVDIASASGQDTFRPGEETELLVGVVNMAPMTVSGNVSLKLPNGWKVEPVNGNVLEKIGAGQRKQVAFKLSVPKDAKLDFFAFENPITAEITFTEGVEGTLSARMQPFVKPTLDIRVVYGDQMLNPWQELTPPILRWGWDSEVQTPPPPPMAVRSRVSAKLELDARADLIGKPLALSVVHENGTKGDVYFKTGRGEKPLENTMEVVFNLPIPGKYILTGKVGGFEEKAEFEAAAGVETAAMAVQQMAFISWHPTTGTPIGLASQKVAKGTPVKIELSEEAMKGCNQLLKCNPKGFGKKDAIKEIPYVRTAVGIIFNADADENGDGAYEFRVQSDVDGKLPKAPPRVSCEQPDADHMVVSGDSYKIFFNTTFGWIEKMQLKTADGWNDFLVERTGPVLATMDGKFAGPETSSGATSLTYTFNNVSGYLEFQRPLDDGHVSMKECWTFEPNHMKVDIRMYNNTRAPVRYRSLVYEIGANDKTAPVWKILDEEGKNVDSGRVDSGRIGQTTKGQTMILDTDKGPSMAVTLRRCAQNMAWAAINNTVQHGAALTKIDLVRSMSVDPGDFILAEFDWWPSTDSRPAVGDPHVFVYADESRNRK